MHSPSSRMGYRQGDAYLLNLDTIIVAHKKD